ncbi:hypothetical protein CYLTODRAFT_450828 [Cylindrobasidium torrendii FP15055 ss-10]|uniref:Carbohydrate-binding module family 50 protein n=1 Tax=Cylindrobasidium torrendii FP15055 ss-10 TaxID=1314674 RepID=A0A0D7BMF6_9AGAR|nr:hypothetical protein CYLTODRAFT_450828 [Cylindrobasidium torrendii FP15055 ss-10]
MGRWTQFDDDHYRLGGLKRTAYDADTRTYTYTDPKTNQKFVGVPGTDYDIAGPLRKEPIFDRPGGYADDSVTPRSRTVPAKEPSMFREFVSNGRITAAAPPPPEGHQPAFSRFTEAARRTALPKVLDVVEGLKRSATSARASYDQHNEKRALLRNGSNASSYYTNEKDPGYGRSKSRDGVARQRQYASDDTSAHLRSRSEGASTFSRNSKHSSREASSRGLSSTSGNSRLANARSSPSLFKS